MRVRSGICIAAFLAFSLFAHAVHAQSGQAAAAGARFRVLRSVSGASGHEQDGRFIMDDARSVFVAGQDAKVIVYFEWEGPVGPHHFEGLWKSPEGKIVLISDFRYEATTTHYSGYWSMLLASTSPSGEWNLEARIDGEAAGAHSFIVTGPTGSAAAPKPAAPPERAPLSAAEIYKTSVDSSVAVESLASDGSRIRKSSGFWISEDSVLTSFLAIDGASSLRLQTRQGQQITLTDVVAWNRWQDWALLRSSAKSKVFLKRGPAKTMNVGDHCVFLEWGSAGAEITDGSIAGKSNFPKAGERFIVASGATAESNGTALLNEFGEYVGMVGGSIVPGGSPMQMLWLLNKSTDPQQNVEQVQSQALAVPLSLLPEPYPALAATSLAEMAEKGLLIAPVKSSRVLGFAELAAYLEKNADRTTFPRDYRQVFRKSEGKASLYVNWDSQAKQKIQSQIRLYDVDNKLLTDSKPRPLTINPGKLISTVWDVPVGMMPPGVYRADLLVDGAVIWRSFFRVVE